MVILVNFEENGGEEANNNNNSSELSMKNSRIAGGESILLPLSQHGLTTLQNLGKMCPESTLRASPFCHESSLNQREVYGWVLDTPSSAAGSTLPIPYNLFHGITIAQCEVSESEVLGLMQNIESTRAKLSQAIIEIMEPIRKEQLLFCGSQVAEESEEDGISSSSRSKRASWARCRPSEHHGHPSSLLHATRDKDGNVVFQQDCFGKSTPIIDSEDWLPELSPDGYIGFFHHWLHGTRESRLCLYVVCQSYLPKACIEFADMVHRAGDMCTAGYVCLSDEAQWLRTACSRNRARLIADVCQKMNIKVPTSTDYNSFGGGHRKRDLAIITTETLHHDMMMVNEDQVRILDHCSETRFASNGSVCSMAPWEGVWIFQGLNPTYGFLPHCMSSGYNSIISDFGKPYGVNVILPTSSPRITTTTKKGGKPIAGPYMFVSADPTQCKPLQIWNLGDYKPINRDDNDDDDDDGDNSNSNAKKKEPIIVVVSQQNKKLAATPSSSSCSVSTEGLDPDVIEAFQKSMALRACPVSYQMPNVPGALPPPAVAHNYLVFDENVLKSMSRLGWSRTQGIVKLTPLACGLYEHWKSQQQHHT
jgi:hypothetical protein